MTVKKKPLPIGIDDFEKIIAGDYYYVDKTNLIRDLLDMRGEVTLFTRPRRFGKTLNMSILRYFFEDTGAKDKNEYNRKLFRGMKIMEAGDVYTNEMTKYPVISLSLKSGKQPDFAMALESIQDEIIKEFNRHNDIINSGKLLDNEIERFKNIQRGTASRLQYAKALEFLSSCLMKCCGIKVIILIDEYDVPLENAYFEGFYDQMASFIRSLLESALKTNPYLSFAVITGCLRITRESIFTGLNNLEIVSIMNENYGEYFGFMQWEADEMLSYYERESAGETLKSWYDGYRFGNAEVYNPWSVINFVKALNANPEAYPSPYWANTSSNNIVKMLIEGADVTVKGEIERLIDGGWIEKQMHEDITFEDIEESQDNLWNFLLFTGYLRLEERRMEGDMQYGRMMIPNTEVRYLYKSLILSWFDQIVRQKDLAALFRAIEYGDAEIFTKELSENLQETISFYDYAENYYHGFVAGLLKNMDKYQVISNRESGAGRPDLILKTPSVSGAAIIIELKAVKSLKDLQKGCREALRQFQNMDYERELRKEGYEKILKYGISFFKKECLVLAEE